MHLKETSRLSCSCPTEARHASREQGTTEASATASHAPQGAPERQDGTRH